MLTSTDVDRYRRDGLLVLPALFTPTEIAALRDAYDRDTRVPGDHRIVEADSMTAASASDSDSAGASTADADATPADKVRALYASHLRQPEFAALVRAPRLVRAARQLLGPELYLYQFKINAKPAGGGDGWAWHQDYVAWRIADLLRTAELVSAVLFLDEVTADNGPIAFVPGSHTDGLVRADRGEQERSSQHLDPDDIAVPPALLDRLVARRGVTAPTGAAGTVVFFHPELVHGSSPNNSTAGRRVAIATYNSVHNTPLGEPRAEYLVCRDTRPLPVEDDLPIIAAV
ncbi:phytanoyl-CoA dioxygenase family protein [Kitasatospora sp. NBC_01266]|uniref:phytanoyl-CoA dioxygenase family protein n=1 Tax=Kitasatospora sp. NBC_01266 TaxID=2903572 RepID=UPI002E374920|nr:phytanoyl-CoA dioxygenase family protein [Kitasatospora sp. NBC_01266]